MTGQLSSNIQTPAVNRQRSRGWQCVTNKLYIWISKILCLIYNFNFTTLYVTRFKLGDFNSVFLWNSCEFWLLEDCYPSSTSSSRSIEIKVIFLRNYIPAVSVYVHSRGGRQRQGVLFWIKHHKCTHAHTWSSKPDGVKKDAWASWQILEITSLSGTVTLPPYYIPI